MRDHSHFSIDNSGVCSHCGQPLTAPAPQYGARGPNRTGLAVTVLLHLLLVAVYLIQPKQLFRPEAASRGGEIVYVAPLKAKPKPTQAPKKTSKAKAAPERVQIQRLPNTITLPDEKPVEVAKAEPKPEPKVEPQPAPEMDMAAAIEARRKSRGAPATPAAEETDDERGKRIAMANIAAANGRSRDDGGTAEATLLRKTFNSAEVKITVWNPYLKRHMNRILQVELGSAPDIETALINEMMEYVHTTMRPDFDYTLRNGSVIKVSSRREDAARLRNIMFKDMFPEYRRLPQ